MVLVRRTIIVGCLLVLAACGAGTAGDEVVTNDTATTTPLPSAPPTWQEQEGPLQLAVWVNPENPATGEPVEFLLLASDERGGVVNVAMAFGDRELEEIPTAPDIDCDGSAETKPGSAETSRALTHAYAQAGRYQVVAVATSGDCDYSDALTIKRELVVAGVTPASR